MEMTPVDMYSTKIDSPFYLITYHNNNYHWTTATERSLHKGLITKGLTVSVWAARSSFFNCPSMARMMYYPRFLLLLLLPSVLISLLLLLLLPLAKRWGGFVELNVEHKKLGWCQYRKAKGLTLGVSGGLFGFCALTWKCCRSSVRFMGLT